MSIVQRRVFYAKIGNADQLVEHLREAETNLRQYGVEFNTRILTDYMSGRTDRVVAEWEVDYPGELEKGMEQAMSNPDALAYFNPWMEKLNGLIHYAEVEHWSVR